MTVFFFIIEAHAIIISPKEEFIFSHLFWGNLAAIREFLDREVIPNFCSSKFLWVFVKAQMMMHLLQTEVLYCGFTLRQKNSVFPCFLLRGNPKTQGFINVGWFLQHVIVHFVSSNVIKVMVVCIKICTDEWTGMK